MQSLSAVGYHKLMQHMHSVLTVAQDYLLTRAHRVIPRARAHFRLSRGTKVALWKMTAIAVLNITLYLSNCCKIYNSKSWQEAGNSA